MKYICIFASGNGSNAEAIIQHFADSRVAHVALVLCDKPQAGVLARAERLGVPTQLLGKEDLEDGGQLSSSLKTKGIDLIVLAGFLRLLPKGLVRAFPNAIVNIHPSLLPKYGGKGMYGHHVHQAVVDAGETESGMTIHFVNERYDEGQVLFQASCPVQPDDDAQTLASRVMALEHEHYPKQLEKLLS